MVELLEDCCFHTFDGESLGDGGRASFTICKHFDDISEWSGPHLCTGEILLPFIFPTQETRFDEWGAGEDSKR